MGENAARDEEKIEYLQKRRKKEKGREKGREEEIKWGRKRELQE